MYIFLTKHCKSGIPLPLSKGGWDLISWFGFLGVILIQIEILFSSQSPPHPRYLSLRSWEETSKWFLLSSDEQVAAANSKPSAVLLLRQSVDVGWRCLHRHGRRWAKCSPAACLHSPCLSQWLVPLKRDCSTSLWAWPTCCLSSAVMGF